MKLRKVDDLRIFRRKENSASTRVYVLYLNPDKFSDTTAKFINYFKHQLMIIIVNIVEEILELINGQVADNLAETFIPRRTSGPFLQSSYTEKIVLSHLHSNVKSVRFINISVCVIKLKVWHGETRPDLEPQMGILRPPNYLF